MTTLGTVNGIDLTATAPLAQAIYNWAVSKAPTIADILAIGGGWEVWAQVDIALERRHFAITSGLPANLVEREEGVFTKPKTMADFAILAPALGWPRHIVELKVESAVATGASTFVTSFTGDVDRLIELRMKAPNMVGVTGVAIGISFSVEADKILQGIFQSQPDPPRRFPVPGFPVPGHSLIVWVYAHTMQ